MINNNSSFIILVSIIVLLSATVNTQDFVDGKVNITCRKAHKKCPTGDKSLVYQSALALDQTCVGSDACPVEFIPNLSVVRYSGSCDLAGCASKCCTRPNLNDNTGQQCLAFSDFRNQQFCTGLSAGAIAGILIGSIMGVFFLLIILICVYSKFFGSPEEQDQGKQSDKDKLVKQNTQNYKAESKLERLEQHGSQTKFVIE